MVTINFPIQLVIWLQSGILFQSGYHGHGPVIPVTVQLSQLWLQALFFAFDEQKKKFMQKKSITVSNNSMKRVQKHKIFKKEYFWEI